MSRHFLFPSLLMACAAVAGCGPSQTVSTPELPRPVEDHDKPAPPPAEPTVVTTSLASVGLDPAAMDTSVEPCADFFAYACGGWLQSTEIPPDKARHNRFSEVAERTEALLHELLEAARAAVDPDPTTARLGQFYGACMDEAAIEKAGLSGVEPLLAIARNVRRQGDVPRAIAELHRHGIWAVFSSWPLPDFKDTTRYILSVDTAGLGLPDRDYYLGEDEVFARARAFYRGHVQRMLQLTGMSQAAARRAADEVLKLETELARVTKTKVQRRDLAGLYNKIDREGLIAAAPSFGWAAYFAALGRPDLHEVSVTTPDYVTRLEALLGSVKPAAWSAYLQWHIVHHAAPTLPRRFVDESFALVRALTDQPELAPRWKRCVTATGDAMGELLGRRYVDEHFPEASKRTAEAMIREIRRAFAATMRGLDWMTEATRTEALAKLEAMSKLIGYPEVWKEYDFDIDAKNFARSMLAAQVFETRRNLAKPGNPYDRREWYMTPQTVNAYYSALANQMAFPAGILQPPFFGKDRAVAVNMGAIGMVMGHELTHGFDDGGARFDAAGNLRNWWHEDDAKKFEEKGQCLVEQYSRFEPLPGVQVNGQLTLGENIADLGGVKLAFHAYRAMRAGASERYVADGYSEDQQFFLAMAQAWCSQSREAEARRRVVVDTHAPPRFRVIGTLQNTPEFAEAFQCSESAPMRPPTTCAVW